MTIHKLYNYAISPPSWITEAYDLQYAWLTTPLEKECILTFQGTWSYVDCLIDAVSIIPGEKGLPLGVTKALRLSFDTIYKELLEVLKTYKIVHITGWSLGAMYAQVFCSWLPEEIRKRVRCATFGSPAIFPLWWKNDDFICLNILKFTDLFVRPMYPLRKRIGATLYIGKQWFPWFTEHDNSLYEKDLLALSL